jgi:hypothetical protein
MSRDFYEPRTATDLALFHYNLRLGCRRCPHTAVLCGYSVWWLCERRRWPTALPSLMHRFYCEPCLRGRFFKVTNPRYESTRDPPTDRRLVEPAEEQWKRMVKRHRT